jgi:hypothetical protein
MIEAVSTSETLVNFYETTRRSFPEHIRLLMHIFPRAILQLSSIYKKKYTRMESICATDFQRSFCAEIGISFIFRGLYLRGWFWWRIKNCYYYGQGRSVEDFTIFNTKIIPQWHLNNNSNNNNNNNDDGDDYSQKMCIAIISFHLQFFKFITFRLHRVYQMEENCQHNVWIVLIHNHVLSLKVIITDIGKNMSTFYTRHNFV